MRRATLETATFLALALLPACATVAGTVAGPVAFPISDIKHKRGVPVWARLFTVPFGIVIGPFYGAAQGASADFGYVVHGAYGEQGRPGFDVVIDPLAVDPDWREVTER